MSRALTGLQVTVMGLGRFGGGTGVANWLCDQGATVLATDLSSEIDLRDSLSDLSDHVQSGDMRLRCGGHVAGDFTDCDLVVVNPAVPKPWNNIYLQHATQRGIPLTTEIRLLAERLRRDRVIGVTGTAGKSTTAAMVNHILRSCGRPSHLGGNIGGSLLRGLDEIGNDDWVVLELSSAMLHWLGAGVGKADAPGFSPHVAVLTNIEPNHIDWHGSFEHYRDSKQNIFRGQVDGDHAITGNDLLTVTLPTLRVPGIHNRVNARFAITATTCAADIAPDDAAAALSDFGGLPHRLCLVAEHDGLTFYDDSKSTTPRATILAVEAFDDPSRVHLIAGGYDKQIDLAPISALSARIAGLYTIGQTGPGLVATASDRSRSIPCDTLDAAVERATARMASGDILLLSPGCASWDQFDNYIQRGDAFVRAVNAIISSGSMTDSGTLSDGESESIGNVSVRRC